MSSTTIILGAGYVGLALAQRLAQAGSRVLAVRRRGADGDTTPGVEWIAGDARDPATMTQLPTQCDAVVLAAAPTRARGDTHDNTYASMATAAVDVATRCQARRLVYTSSTGVYGGTDGAVITEASPLVSRGPGDAALREAEAVVRSAPGAIGVVLRVAGIYGPGRNPVPRYEHPEQLPACGAYYVNLAHRDDICSAIVQVMSTANPPAILNCADGSPRLALDIARWVCTNRGLRWPDPLVFEAPDAPSRSNQRIENLALRGIGWAPTYPTFAEGFLSLMYPSDGTAAEPQP